MSAMTYTPVLTGPVPATNARALWFARAVHAEWIKFWTVRSTVWTLISLVVVMVGISTLAAWGSTVADLNSGSGSMNTAQLLSAGYQMGQLAIAVLAVLTITGEYSTGMMRSTLTAIPRRTEVLAAKAVVLSVVVFVVSVITMALSFVATMPWQDQLGATLDLADGETFRMTVGLPLYLVAIALFAFAVGALVRNSAAALTAVIALLVVVETVLSIIPLRAIQLVSPFLPSTAGRRVLIDADMLAVIDSGTAGAHLNPWLGYVVLMAWVVVLGTSAMMLLRRRDA